MNIIIASGLPGLFLLINSNQFFSDNFFTSMPKTEIILFAVAAVLVIGNIVALLFVINRSLKRRKREDELIGIIKRLLEQPGDTYHIIDIRENEIFQKKHIPTAMNIPAAEIENFFPTEMMFSRIIVCGDKASDVKKATKNLSDRAYFRVDPLFSLKKWDGEWETGKGKDPKSEQGDFEDEVQ